MNFISATFGASTAVAATITTMVFYLLKLSTLQKVAFVAAAGVFTIILSAILSIGIDYLVRKYANRNMLQTW